jgi:hypothetical protein
MFLNQNILICSIPLERERFKMDVKVKLAELRKQLEKAYDLPNFQMFQKENDRIWTERNRILSFCNHQILKKPKSKSDLVTCIHCKELFWFCPSSPNQVCKYNDKLDPAHDNCIYCNKPQERK